MNNVRHACREFAANNRKLRNTLAVLVPVLLLLGIGFNSQAEKHWLPALLSGYAFIGTQLAFFIAAFLYRLGKPEPAADSFVSQTGLGWVSQLADWAVIVVASFVVAWSIFLIAALPYGIATT